MLDEVVVVKGEESMEGGRMEEGGVGNEERGKGDERADGETVRLDEVVVVKVKESVEGGVMMAMEEGGVVDEGLMGDEERERKVNRVETVEGGETAQLEELVVEPGR